MIPGAPGGVDTPPLSLPGSHFAAGLLFYCAGAAVLALAAPHLAAGSYLSPQVVAATHLFTLGWITTSILGALYQLLPVALGRPVRWVGAAWGALPLHGGGLTLFVVGLLTGRSVFTAVGATVMVLGLLVFAANLAATLVRATPRDTTWWALTLACLFLVLTLIVGAALAGNVAHPFMGAARIPALATHLHVALVGWVLLVVVGVGIRLLPMFLLSHGVGTRPAAVSVALLGAGAGALFALHHLPGALARRVPAALMLAGVVAFLLQARAFFRTGKRPSLDAGLRMAAAGLMLLAAGALQGGWLAFTGFAHPGRATAYVATVILGFAVFVAGHYYKIVPFLLWFHRYAPRAGKEKVPTVSEMYSGRVAGLAGALQVAGAAAIIGATFAGFAWQPAAAVIRSGGALLLAGAALQTLHLATLAWSRDAGSTDT